MSLPKLRRNIMLTPYKWERNYTRVIGEDLVPTLAVEVVRILPLLCLIIYTCLGS
jgi:hypothetical protein